MDYNKRNGNKFSLKLILLFIPVAFVSYLFHEFGHWIVGEMLGNDMGYSLNYVWPKQGYYAAASHELFVSIGGPAFTIFLSLVFLLIIEKFQTIYAYPFVFFQFFCRFFSLSFGGFSHQDEARIAGILDIGTYTIAIIGLSLLFMMLLRANHLLKVNLKNTGYFIAISTVSHFLVIWTSNFL